MDRDAFLSRTRLADDEKHVNRLVMPRIGIVSLSVSVGDKASKPHLPDDAPPPPDQGTDDFHFVPQKENAKISYEIDDPFAIVDTAKLEIFGRFSTTALWTLDLTVLGEGWYTHGKHEVDWDGQIVEAVEQTTESSKDLVKHDLTKLKIDTTIAAFPDGYLTLEHTPYKVKLTLESKESKVLPVTAWTYVQILIKSLQIDFAPEACVPKVDDNQHTRDKEILEFLRKTSKKTPYRIFLHSNLYKTSDREMENNTAFDVYKSLWGDGPNIPLLARIRLADSAGGEVKLEEGKGAVALGKVKFLWDWQDPDEYNDLQQNAGKPKDFISAAVDYDKQKTEPKGDNCHVDRGGKRGPNAAPVFPACDGYDPKSVLEAGRFPFKVEPCTTRSWSAYSYGWTKEALAGQTGVLFRPSRMAGDNYVIAVYLAYDKTGANDFALDKKDQPLKAAKALTQTSKTFTVWRRIDIVRYIRKIGGVEDFLDASFIEVDNHYRKAFIVINDKRENDANNTYLLSEHKLANRNQANYYRICQDALAATANPMFTGRALARDQNETELMYKNMKEMFYFVGYAAFVMNVHMMVNPAHDKPKTVQDFKAAADQVSNPPPPLADFINSFGTQPQAQLASWAAGDLLIRLTRTWNWLDGNLVKSPARYSEYLKDNAPAERVINGLQVISGGKASAAEEGITVVHFHYTHNVERILREDGTPVNITNGVAVNASDATRDHCVFILYQPFVDTFAHEIGHHLFLPHARDAYGFVAKRHDDDDDNCFMTYNPSRNAFCGLCQLRLRGWHADRLSQDDAANKKV